MINYNLPVSISICSEGKWKKAGPEVEVKDNRITLEADTASWVKVTWSEKFSNDSMVLCDAWERVYGDIGWKTIDSPFFSPWYITVRENNVFRCFGVKTSPNAFCSWTLNTESITLLLDVRCGCKDTKFGGRKLVLAELVSYEHTGEMFDAIHEFCKMMCESPKLPGHVIYGGDEWYCNYSNNSFEAVMDHAKILAECSKGLKNRPYQVVDAGWQLCHNWSAYAEYIGGPFKLCNSKFGDMKALAEAMKEIEVRPAIWLRPLETVEFLPEEAIIRRDKFVKYMDVSHPTVKQITSEDMQRLRDWGYDMIKHDFAAVDTFGKYGMDMTESIVEGDWSFYEDFKTSAEITNEYYRQVAKDAGGAVVNACNTFSHMSAGVFESFRIGDDTSGLDFSRTVKMGVNALAVRGAQHNAFYAADPDCVGITSNVPWEKNEEWLKLLTYSGMAVLVSVAKDCYTKQVQEAITNAFAISSAPHEVARPLDFDETLTPACWMTFEGEKKFNW